MRRAAGVVQIGPMSRSPPFKLAEQLTADFRLGLRTASDAWSVTAQGTLDAADSAARVQPELLRLHAALVEAKIPLVSLDVADVDYMNSSALKAFMAWFLAASNEKAHRYRIEVSIDPSRSWQKLSFQPMERLAPETVKLLPRAGR